MSGIKVNLKCEKDFEGKAKHVFDTFKEWYNLKEGEDLTIGYGCDGDVFIPCEKEVKIVKIEEVEEMKEKGKIEFDLIKAIFFLTFTKRGIEYIEENGLYLTPLTDYYCDLLFELLRKVARQKGIEIERKREKKIILTHDVDLIRKKLYPLNFVDFYELYLINRKYKKYFPDTKIFFLSGIERPYGSNYRANSIFCRPLIFLSRYFFSEIGLHIANVKKIIRDKKIIEKLSRKSVRSARAHYLLLDYPSDLLEYEKSGILYDFSMGYRDKIGFKCGTCRPFWAYSTAFDRKLKVKVYPLFIMDSAIYRMLKNNENIWEKIRKGKKEIEKFGGEVSILFHNISPVKKLYPIILKKLLTNS